MNTKIFYYSVPLKRLARNCSTPSQKFYSALKQQKETPVVNCSDLMKTYESADLIKPTSTQQNNGTSAAQILRVCEKTFSISNFVKALRVLRIEHRQTKKLHDLTGDLQFIKHCQLLAANCQNSSPFLLISALKSLLALEIDRPLAFVEAIEDTILRKIDQFDGSDMLECLLVLYPAMNSEPIAETRREIIQLLLKELPKKFHEFSDGSSVFKLVKVYDQFDMISQKKLDFKLAGLIKDFSLHYHCKLLFLLAEKGNRNKPLLNAISKGVQNSRSKPILKQTADCLFALDSLNFPDSSLIKYLTDGRASEISAVKQPNRISSLLTVCRYLRWRHKELMESCGSWIVNNKDECSYREPMSYILTAAALNYEISDDVLRPILPLLKKEKVSNSILWLDFVWSLAVLNHVEKEMLLGVLRKDFYEPMLVAHKYDAMPLKKKLMNLKAVLKNKHPEFIFSCDLFLDYEEELTSADVESNKEAVIEALSNFILPEKHMYTNVCTDMGIFLDAEFISDKKGRPLPLSEYGSQTKPSTQAEILPTNAKRVAVLVLSYEDFTLHEQCVTGTVALNVQLLKSQGYVVVQIPYAEFSENKTTVKRAHYLQNKIATAVETAV